jgi:hypothetical protein
MNDAAISNTPEAVHQQLPGNFLATETNRFRRQRQALF